MIISSLSNKLRVVLQKGSKIKKRILEKEKIV